MAKPIKETPVLRGKDAERFSEEVRANEKKKVTKAEYKKAMAAYKELHGRFNIL